VSVAGLLAVVFSRDCFPDFFCHAIVILKLFSRSDVLLTSPSCADSPFSSRSKLHCNYFFPDSSRRVGTFKANFQGPWTCKDIARFASSQRHPARCVPPLSAMRRLSFPHPTFLFDSILTETRAPAPEFCVVPSPCTTEILRTL